MNNSNHSETDAQENEWKTKEIEAFWFRQAVNFLEGPMSRQRYSWETREIVMDALSDAHVKAVDFEKKIEERLEKSRARRRERNIQQYKRKMEASHAEV